MPVRRAHAACASAYGVVTLRHRGFSQDLEIFEIDHPATQALKIQRIKECGISLPRSVHFVAADLAGETLSSVLDRSAFRRDKPAFFSCLGVTSFLTREVNLATLGAVATCAARGSELVFTYIDQIEFDSTTVSGLVRDLNAGALTSMGEPLVSGFYPNDLAKDLQRVGLELVEDLDGQMMSERYGRAGTNPLRPQASSHIALARIG
jgi:methyltransferase (TIGR00027 family)